MASEMEEIERVLDRSADGLEGAGAELEVLAEARLARLGLARGCARALEKIFADDAELRTSLRAYLAPGRVVARLEAVSLDAVLAPEPALTLLRSSRGFSNYLIAPEAGIGALLAACLMVWLGPAVGLLREAAAVLEGAAVAAVETACGGEAAPEGEGRGKRSRVKGTRPVAFPGLDALATQVFREAATDAARLRVRAVRDATERLLERLLAAESRFPSCSAFLELRAQLLRAGGTAAMAVATAAAQVAARGTTAVPAVPLPAHAQAPPPAAPAPAPAAPVREYTMGWLEKLNRRGRWQRRWVAVSPVRGKIWYHHTPRDEIPAAELVLAEARLLPLPSDHAVAARAAAREPVRHHGWSTRAATAEAGDAGERRIWLRVPGASPTLPPRDLVLRAPTAEVRVQWERALAEAIRGALVPVVEAGALTRIGLLTAAGTAASGGERGPAALVPPGAAAEHAVEGGPKGSATAEAVPTPQPAAGGAPVPHVTASASREAELERALAFGGRSLTGEGSSLSSASDPASRAPTSSDDSEDGSRRRRRDEATFEAIAKDSRGPASQAEVRMLAAVLPAVRTYVEAVRKRLGDQISKVILEAVLEGPGDVGTDLIALI